MVLLLFVLTSFGHPYGNFISSLTIAYIVFPGSGLFCQAGITWSSMVSPLLNAELLVFFLNNFKHTVRIYVMLGDRKNTLVINNNSQLTFVVLFMWAHQRI